MIKLKTKLSYTLYILLASVFLTSCTQKEVYPKYSLYTINKISDSLKVDYRTWITETIRSASQNMTGGDYENVDETIRQAKETADEIFGTKVIGLRKEIDDNYWNDLKLKPSELSDKELIILDSLSFSNAR